MTAGVRWLAADRGEGPSVVHAHDWQAAPVTWEDLKGAKKAFTIHNLEYGADLIGGAMAVSWMHRLPGTCCVDRNK